MVEPRQFQSRTIDYVSERFWSSESSTRRFLVADEVGLGKTLVARGVVERGLDWARRSGRPFRVVYVCANAVLAEQNRTRLFRGLEGLDEPPLADRLTSLCDRLPSASESMAAAFTPGTSFHLARRLGRADERALLLAGCRRAKWPGCDRRAAEYVFRGGKALGAFRWMIEEAHEAAVDPRVVAALRSAHDLKLAFRQLLPWFTRKDSPGNPEARAEFVAGVRRLVTSTVLSALSPDLVILDEFQRFRYLIEDPPEGEDPGASEVDEGERMARDLAKELMGTEARVLLLSATPFKFFTCAGEDSDHWSDFSAVLRFLLGLDGAERVHGALGRWRESVLRGDAGAAEGARAEAEAMLRTVISRHERVGATDARDGMLRTHVVETTFDARDAGDALAWIRLARRVGHHDALGLWVSTPYARHFLDEYKLGEQIGEHSATARGREALAGVTGVADAATLPSKRRIQRYDFVPDAHPMLRWIKASTVDEGWWRVPWMPPTTPYWKLSNGFASVGPISKQLVFSGWRSVPRALPSMLSYAAEQAAVAAARPVGGARPVVGASSEDEDDLWWQRADATQRPVFRLFGSDRAPAWSSLSIVYPSRVLVRVGADLARADSAPADPSSVLAEARVRIERLLRELPSAKTARVDERWYGIAPVLLDQLAQDTPSLETDDVEIAAETLSVAELLTAATTGVGRLGKMPSDLSDVLALISLAGPAVCARRALQRSHDSRAVQRGVGALAARMGLAVARYLEKRPHNVALRSDYPELPFWRCVLARGFEGCIQAVLDEQLHLLVGGGLTWDAAGREVVEALELNTARVDAGPLPTDGPGASEPHFRFRTHFAVRFGSKESLEGGGEEPQVARLRRVMGAFNSPWWPMILVTTSLGQEGLDFHRWCSRVVHWNLPWNPIDLEQREGRVHRFRGLAVRRNVATIARDRLSALKPNDDPWRALFSAIDASADGMSPDWVTPGEHRVERVVPMLPMAREAYRLEELSRVLGVYRSLLGQPRQEELVQLVEAGGNRALLAHPFDLRPPRRDEATAQR